MFGRRAIFKFYGIFWIAIAVLLLSTLFYFQSDVGNFRKTEDLATNPLQHDGKNDFSSTHGYVTQPETCGTTNGSRPIMIVILKLKVDNIKNRRIVRQKWRIVEERCLYKILFLSTGRDVVPDNLDGKNKKKTKNFAAKYPFPPETDLLRVGQLENRLKSQNLQALFNLSLPWVEEKCQPLQAIFVGKDITAKNPIFYLGDMIGQTMIQG
jgi:hypothetical protein